MNGTVEARSPKFSTHFPGLAAQEIRLQRVASVPFDTELVTSLPAYLCVPSGRAVYTHHKDAFRPYLHSEPHPAKTGNRL